MTTDIVLKDEETIKEKMYYIIGKKVMLDFDLAKIYGYTTKAFNQQVKNNIEKFDNDFMFRLDDEEIKNLSRSKILTLNKSDKVYDDFDNLSRFQNGTLNKSGNNRGFNLKYFYRTGNLYVNDRTKRKISCRTKQSIN